MERMKQFLGNRNPIKINIQEVKLRYLLLFTEI